MPTIEIDYCPRRAFQTFHTRSKRWAVVVAHRRSGKTVASINELVKGALTCKRVSPRFAYLAPYRQQAKLIAWDYLKRYTEQIPGRQVSESELHVKLPNDGRVTLYGADNYDALRGIYLDGAVIDEPADMEPEVWTSVIRPALSDRMGWAAWIGTPKGRNSFWRMYDAACGDPEYFTLKLKASESGIIDPGELASAKKQMEIEEPGSYNREFECSFDAPVPGAIYADQINALRDAGHIRDVAFESGHPIDTFWDLGRSDFTCIWLVQFVGRDILLLDFYSATGKNPAHYANKCAEWEKRYGANMRMNYLPHDAHQIDRGGKTWVSDLRDAGMTRIKVVPVTPDKWLGINRLRTLLPRCYIHKTNCSKTHGTGDNSAPSGLDCLEYYHKHIVESGHSIAEEPVHDEFSHGADALRTMAEADRQGMIEGNSVTAQQGREPMRVLRGPGPQSYSVRGASPYQQTALR